MGMMILSDLTCDLISLFSKSHKVCNVKLPIILIQSIVVFLQQDIATFGSHFRCRNGKHYPIPCDAVVGANQCSSLEPLLP